MSNPFENEEAMYIVLINLEGQYSLWPAATDAPSGWTIVYEAASRSSCLEYVNKVWTDMRPKTLIDSMGR
jgi:MbtH protein